MKQISSGIIIYRRTSQGVLFLLLYHGGKYWGFPKGGIEEEERAKETALREVREETGIAARDLTFRPQFHAQDRYTFKSGGGTGYKTVIYFLAESRSARVTISPREHRGYGWFTFKEAMDTVPHKNLQRNLEKANEFVSGEKKGV
ncbi:hypothetical protein A2110_00385 [Candidatus Jorgensenbacteria bacterium GWA1_54_12]|uniref:Bis(5'-nucleosyl)-tetraphosphatase [asymmetrical] n=1 Tax=Candidatus Jorgensenbacteria bacterium GWA1_54_12 TaxID=1798468 RepID=A0A1F6BLI1_9BACT|nr:MAG: hypothetical protein A2110_00385 [Candidatus Jorgensenbacteria bacterium GWA1_54_12]